MLLGCFGIGAAAAAVIRPRLDERFHHDQLVFGSSVLVAATLVVEGVSRMPWAIGVAMFIGGLAWATALTSTGVAAFAALPEWVRARGMGLYMLVLAGAVAIGSAGWGAFGRDQPHGRASRRRRCSAPARWRPVGAGRSARSPGSTCAWSPRDDPTVTIVPHPTDGPVLVTVMYEVPGDDVHAFAERCDWSNVIAAEPAPTAGACSATSPHRISSSRPSSSSHGASIFASTGAPPSTPTASSIPCVATSTHDVVVTHYLSVYSAAGLDQTGHEAPERLEATEP